MAFHAYTKRQFKESGFDTTGYRMLTINDLGDHYATLDSKRWGSRSMFVYLTLGNGEKIVTPVFMSTDYFGFKEIPIGAIVDVGFDYSPRARRPIMVDAEWMKQVSTIEEAENL